jgi:hypothetical protein
MLDELDEPFLASSLGHPQEVRADQPATADGVARVTPAVEDLLTSFCLHNIRAEQNATNYEQSGKRRPQEGGETLG